MTSVPVFSSSKDFWSVLSFRCHVRWACCFLTAGLGLEQLWIFPENEQWCWDRRERERERGLCWVRREGAKANVSNLSFGYFEPFPLLANIQGMPSLREMCVIQGLPLRPRRATLLFTEKQDFQMRWSFFKALRCQFRKKKSALNTFCSFDILLFSSKEVDSAEYGHQMGCLYSVEGCGLCGLGPS